MSRPVLVPVPVGGRYDMRNTLVGTGTLGANSPGRFHRTVAQTLNGCASWGTVIALPNRSVKTTSATLRSSWTIFLDRRECRLEAPR